MTKSLLHMKVVAFLIFGLIVFFSSCKNKPKGGTGDIDTLTSSTKSKEENTTKKMDSHIKQLDTNYCMGKFEPDNHSEFESIPEKYADRSGMYLRKDVLTKFKSMWEVAKKDGINLQIRSATRNFDYQKGIWERKWTGATILSDGTNVAKDISSPKEKALKILEYSSMPGTSRHHWGTDIDLNAFSNSFFEKGEGKLLYDWMLKNAATFGFCQPYTAKGPKRPHGYNEEKWHWTYQPLGSKIMAFAKENLKNQMISGFKGAETAEDIDVVRKYVLGINSQCK